MSLTYPESSWMYRINSVFYWPYRDNSVTQDQAYIIPRGQHRYFRFNVKKEYVRNLSVQASAAGVWLRNLACYDVPGGLFCEGYIEPKYEGVTYKSLASKLFPWAMEISTHPSGFIDEALQDFDDYLYLDYHTIHPVQLATIDDTLHPHSYYPANALYRGYRKGALTKAPPVATIAAKLRANSMDFYQPYPTANMASVPFVLKTGAGTTTPKIIAELLGADVVIVNLQALPPEAQSKLQAYDAGENIPDAVVNFFGTAGSEVSKIIGGGEFLLKGVKYLALAGLVVGGIWLGLKAVPPIRQAFQAAGKGNR